MIRRTDNGNWALPGGAIDLGESVAQAAARETLEEAGIECVVTGIVGIYSDPKHVILYISDHVVQHARAPRRPVKELSSTRPGAHSIQRSSSVRFRNTLTLRPFWLRT